MLCLQQCVDLCDFSTEEAEAIREHATLAEVLAIRAACPHDQAALKGTVADEDAVAGCDMLDIRDQLLEEVWAADDFDDLERVVHHYCAYEEGRDADGAEAG